VEIPHYSMIFMAKDVIIENKNNKIEIYNNKMKKKI
jgi:hypothetical protein